MPQSSGTTTRLGRWPWGPLVCLWLALAIFSSIPYVVGWAAKPTGQEYLGRIISAPGDVAAYYSNMTQAAHGHLLFQNNFTAEPQQPRLVEPIWLVGGWLMFLLHMSPVVMYHLLRVVAIFPLLLVLWLWASKMSNDRIRRWIIMMVAVTSSGLGWLSLTFLRLPLGFDAWVAESNTFLSMTHSALFLLSQALLAWLILRAWERLIEGRQDRWWGVWAAVLAINHPYDILTLGAVVGCIWVFALVQHKTQAASFVLQALWLLPVGLYYWWALREPALAGWTQQNIGLSGSIGRLFIGYAWMWVLGGIGFFLLMRQKKHFRWVVVFWVGSASVLIYLPFIHFQRRLSSGLDIPFTILGGYAVAYFAQKIRHNIKRWLVITLVIILLALTNIHLISVTAQHLARGQAPYPANATADEQHIIQVIAQQVPDHQPILSDIWVGNDIAGLTTKTVVLGHGQQTLRVDEKTALWQEYLHQSTATARRNEIITQLGAKWLVWQPSIDNEYQPENDSAWEDVAATPTMSLYRLK